MSPVLLILLLAAGWILATLAVVLFFMGASRSHRAEREHWAAAPGAERSDAAGERSADTRIPLG